MKCRIRNKTAAALAVAFAAAGLVAVAAPQPVHAATGCGLWRWPVKTGSDATRFQVSRTILLTSVGYLDHRVPPASFGSYAQNHRIKWPEFRTWQINRVTLVAVKLEDDGDLHLRLRSSTGQKMIGEIPRPGCVSSAGGSVEDRHHQRATRCHEPVFGEPVRLALHLPEHQHPRARLL
jgi:hypothetical protein